MLFYTPQHHACLYGSPAPNLCNPRHWKHWLKNVDVRGEGSRGWKKKKHCSGAQRSSWSSTASTFVFNSDIWQPCAVSIKCRMVCRGTWMWVISSARRKNEQRGEEEKYREKGRTEREAGGEKGNRASWSVPSHSFNTAPTFHSFLGYKPFKTLSQKQMTVMQHLYGVQHTQNDATQRNPN